MGSFVVILGANEDVDTTETPETTHLQNYGLRTIICNLSKILKNKRIPASKLMILMINLSIIFLHLGAEAEVGAGFDRRRRGEPTSGNCSKSVGSGAQEDPSLSAADCSNNGLPEDGQSSAEESQSTDDY